MGTIVQSVFTSNNYDNENRKMVETEKIYLSGCSRSGRYETADRSADQTGTSLRQPRTAGLLLQTEGIFLQLIITTMKIKARTVIMSHLSDVKYTMTMPTERETNSTRINFAKYLLLKYSNTDQEIDPDVEYRLYLNLTESLKQII
jgi:hypothetical protein